ncbi:MAG: Fic/DOC family N-terminal domain-containing protein [Duganella sp.]
MSITWLGAWLSSEVEKVVTNNDELYRVDACTDAKTDRHTKEVLRYRQAQHMAYRLCAISSKHRLSAPASSATNCPMLSTSFVSRIGLVLRSKLL